MKDWNLEWDMDSNLDHIFDVIKKTVNVITSCETQSQLEGAAIYVKNVEKYFNCFESNAKQSKFLLGKVSHFKTLLALKKKSIRHARVR